MRASTTLTALALAGFGFVGGWWFGRGHVAQATTETEAISTQARTMQPRTEARTTTSDRPQPYALPNTFVHSVPNSVSGRRYEVWVDLPPSYFENDKRYPVVFTTDADYGFPLIRSLRRRVGSKGKNIEDFVLVGLSYAIGEQSMPSKRRDYTPTDPFARPDPPPTGKAYQRGDAYGQAEAYRDYIERDVFPLIAKHYRVDTTRKVYIGHSLGGLFGSYVLLTKPNMFSHYVLGSPSFWFDRRAIFDTEAAYAAAHRDLRANVFLSIGAFETFGNGPRHMRADMVGDMHDFRNKIESRDYPGLRVQSEVLPDEDHLTGLPRTITHGLLWALPGTGPYSGY